LAVISRKRAQLIQRCPVCSRITVLTVKGRKRDIPYLLWFAETHQTWVSVWPCERCALRARIRWAGAYERYAAKGEAGVCVKLAIEAAKMLS